MIFQICWTHEEKDVMFQQVELIPTLKVEVVTTLEKYRNGIFEN